MENHSLPIKQRRAILPLMPFRWVITWLTVIALLAAVPADLAKAEIKQVPDATPEAPQPYNLVVDQDGIYRVTYQDLLASGLDLNGINAADIALVNRGAAVPIFMNSLPVFGPGSYFDFLGQALDSLYTHENIYILEIDPSMAVRVSEDTTRVPKNGQPAPYYTQTLIVENDLSYDYSSPTGDPWFQTSMLVYTTPNTWNFEFDADHYVSDSAPTTLEVKMYGGTDWSASPDHHVVIGVNGVPLADERFDGLANHPVTITGVPVQSGFNNLTLSMPADLGLSYDLVRLDGFTLTYPRAFIAREGFLVFEAAADLFQVDGLLATNVVVYRQEGFSLYKLSNVEMIAASGAFSARFAGTSNPARYYVYSEESLQAPGWTPGRDYHEITSGSADYIMISHPDFIPGLDPLVQARQENGLVVKVVDVRDIYAQFSHGILDPQAIRDYIAHAKNNMGTRFVLLVGGDTYDYFDNLGVGKKSYIPTLYAPTDNIVNYSPVDPLYADTTGDKVPDLALGRFPVTDETELSNLINKSLAFERRTYDGTAIFTADRYYTIYSDALASTLPADWSLDKAYLDNLTVGEARTRTLNYMNNGVSLASYFGHSTPTVWSSQSLFTSNDAATLINSDKPMLITQYGCWNSYYVDPARNSLAHKFLLAGNRGAAAVMGSATLNYIHSQRDFGKLLTPKLAQEDMTIGEAMLQAKQEYAQVRLNNIEIFLGWTLLGDPALPVQPCSDCDDGSTTPVTIAAFLVSDTGTATRFEWSTATQIGNAGFNLYVQTAEKLEQINDQLIPTISVDSFTPQFYSYETQGVAGDAFYIEDVDVLNKTRMHGPFDLGEQFGETLMTEAIDWVSIQAAQADQSLAAPEGSIKTFLPLAVLSREYAAEHYASAELVVDQDGLHRVTYNELIEAGVLLKGAKSADIALTNRGEPVAIFVQAGDTFEPGDYIEFYAKAMNSLYTHNNVYKLVIDPALARRARQNQQKPGASFPSFYMETKTVERDQVYGFAAPNGDPWFDSELFAWTSPKNFDFELSVQDYLAGAAPVSFSIDLWGVTDWIEQFPDHHVVAEFNGVQIADAAFDGQAIQTLQGELPAGVLQDGVNSLRIIMPGDSGVKYEIVNLDKYSVTFPRGFVARDDVLAFTAEGQTFRVSGFSSDDIVAYSWSENSLTRLSPVTSGSSATFVGASGPASYLVSTTGALLSPANIRITSEPLELASGAFNFVIIAHPDFIAGLSPLVQARQAQGYTVKVVNVDDIYARYSYGIFDPLAIKAFIADAYNQMGARYVLLVGGDTYDYLDHLGKGSQSFIPSLYAQTDPIVKFAPVDPLYGDVDGDNLPDLAVGRFPVRTSDELASVISKTLVYADKDYAGSAVFAADAYDGYVRFATESNRFVQKLPANWGVTKAYIDELTLSGARSALINALNSGVALASYVGHSGPTVWSYKGLFKASDAATLTNAGRPSVIAQWGCWNTYYVDPANNTLAHKFLLSGDRGAAAVMGATTLTASNSERLLGNLMIGRLTQPGTTIGDAMLAAKVELARSNSGLLDVLLGWTIMGDPTLVIQP